jgi:hypothetical protein
MVAGAKPGPAQVVPSSDSLPQALQSFATNFASAFAIAVSALPSPGTGHGSVPLPLSAATRHLPRIFWRVSSSFAAYLPIAR